MKKTVLTTVAALFVFIAGAQEKNVVKLGVLNNLYGEYNLGYERIIKENQSINFRIGYFAPTTSFLIDPNDFKTKEFSVQTIDAGFSTSLEYRFYMGKKVAPRGFYVAPYARYARLKGMFTDVIDQTDFDVDAKAAAVGVGAQLGIQWLIKDVVSIDFYFFGAGVDYSNPKLIYTVKGGADYNYDNIVADIRNVVDDVKYISDRTHITTHNPDYLVVRMPMLLPAFRMGLTVGVAFGN